MPVRLFDAHNHLQDGRLAPFLSDILRQVPALGIACAVVNGSAEDDWEAVAALATEHAWIKPSFGLHPWYVKGRSAGWKDALCSLVERFPNAAIGEIGLDRWIDEPQIESQVEAFRWQLELAAKLNRPVSIHCLKAWGLLDQTLRSTPLPGRAEDRKNVPYHHGCAVARWRDANCLATCTDPRPHARFNRTVPAQFQPASQT